MCSADLTQASDTVCARAGGARREGPQLRKIRDCQGSSSASRRLARGEAGSDDADGGAEAAAVAGSLPGAGVAANPDATGQTRARVASGFASAASCLPESAFSACASYSASVLTGDYAGAAPGIAGAVADFINTASTSADDLLGVYYVHVENVDGRIVTTWRAASQTILNGIQSHSGGDTASFRTWCSDGSFSVRTSVLEA